MKQHISELEKRTITFVDAKVDAADCYLRLKQKVDRGDFQKLIDQTLALKDALTLLQTSHRELAQKQQETAQLQHNELQQLRTTLERTRSDLQQVRTQCEKVGSELEAKLARRGPEVPTELSSEDTKLVLAEVEKVAEHMANVDGRLELLEKAQRETANSVYLTLLAWFVVERVRGDK